MYEMINHLRFLPFSVASSWSNLSISCCHFISAKKPFVGFGGLGFFSTGLLTSAGYLGG
jgi:hypothetical protein